MPAGPSLTPGALPYVQCGWRPQVRTGCGKSQTSRYIVDELQKLGRKCVLVRHPMVRRTPTPLQD